MNCVPFFYVHLLKTFSIKCSYEGYRERSFDYDVTSYMALYFIVSIVSLLVGDLVPYIWVFCILTISFIICAALSVYVLTSFLLFWYCYAIVCICIVPKLLKFFRLFYFLSIDVCRLPSVPEDVLNLLWHPFEVSTSNLSRDVDLNKCLVVLLLWLFYEVFYEMLLASISAFF